MTRKTKIDASRRNAAAMMHAAQERAGAISARYSYDELAQLFSLGPTWTWETDAEQRYSYISPTMEAATGILVKDLIGRTRRDCFFVNPAMSPQILSHLDDIENHRPFSDLVFEAVSKEGRRSWICISGIPRFDADGAFTGYFGVSRTLSDKAFVQSGLDNATLRLKRMEALLGEVFESIPLGIALYDRQDNFLTCNQHYRTMYSVIADMLVPGTPLVPILEAAYDRGMLALPPLKPGQTREQARAIWFENRMAQYAKGVYADVTVLSDGRHLQQISKRLDDGTFISVRVDITERVEHARVIEQARKQAEGAQSRLVRAIESLSTGFALWDAENRLVLANSKFESMVAIGLPVHVGETHESMMKRIVAAGQAAGAVGREEEWLAETNAHFNAETLLEDVYPLPDGRWILRRVTLGPTGERVDIRTDITELKNKNQDISAALEQSRLAHDVMDELETPIFVKDEKLSFVFCNEAFARYHGGVPEDFVGKRARDFLTEADALAFEGNEAAVLRSGETYEVEEDYFDQGREKTRLVRKSLITTDSGRRYVAATLFDVTALRQRERAMAGAIRRAEVADRAKSDFLANISHEIRTPMNGVLSMAELLSQGQLEERQRLFVDVIRKSGETLLGTINNILDYSKIDAGSMTLEAKPFPLREAVEDLCGLLAARACEKENKLILHIAPGLPAVATGDEGRLRQIVSNLIGNAIKFTEGGEIAVSVQGAVVDGMLNLDVTVSDTGCGIPDEMIDKIFDRFAQVETDGQTRPGGTGLGLSIVAKLVELMDGTCNVSSAPGAGSTFRVTLPLACPDARPPAILVPEAVRAKRIIIVDPSAVQRQALLEPLSHWGFDACGVESVEMAVALAQALVERGTPPDLLIFACVDAKTSCRDVACAFDAVWPLAPLPKILLTPVSQIAPERTVGAIVGSLSTPIRQADFFHTVLTALQSPRARRAELPAAAAVARTPAQGAARVDVLVAEDNPVNQLVMSQILDMSGLAYQIVADGALAVEAYRELKPSLILMDVNMPRLDGFHATAAIRDMRDIGGDTVPIIGVTAHVLEHEREACLRCGMSDHIAKPISPEALLSRIAHWLPRAGRARA